MKFINGRDCVVFEANDKIYSLDKYIETPHFEIENINYENKI